MPALNDYQKIVTMGEVPTSDLPDIIHAILEHLNLEIVREASPDYVLYDVAKKSEHHKTEN